MNIKPSNIDYWTTNTIKATTSLAESLASNPAISFATESLAAKELLTQALMSNPMEKFFKDLEDARVKQIKEMEESKLKQLIDSFDVTKRLKEFNI